VMSLDGKLSNFAFRLACVVGTYINNHSGDTFVSQETIADVMQVSERTVWGGFAELEAAGYLIVKRGTEALPVGRKRRSGGRGVANVYVPAFDKSQISAGYRSDKFAKYCALIWQKHLVNTQKPTEKYAKNCGPTLSVPSEQNSSPAGALAPERSAHASYHHRRLGPDRFKSWFEQALTIQMSLAFVLMQARELAALGRDHRNEVAQKLLERIEALEARPEMKYCGVWKSDVVYGAGSFTTDSGSIFHANRASVGKRPGTSDSWTLAVKRGRMERMRNHDRFSTGKYRTAQ